MIVINNEKMTIRIIVEDLSFERFCKELIERKEQYPSAKIVECRAGDNKHAENAFMFVAILETKKEK